MNGLRIVCVICPMEKSIARELGTRMQHPSDGRIARAAARSHVRMYGHSVFLLDDDDMIEFFPLSGHVGSERVSFLHP